MVDPDEVRRVANLARLGLDADQETALVAELVAILAHFETLGEVDTEGVEPLSHPFDGRGTPRKDQVHPDPATREELLGLTEHAREGFYVVPRILDDEGFADDPGSGS
jgi:aspartyl-tRNA(Asn)/glutamyl-tRNA(Gln) amidotransferase subunit C